MINLSTCSSSEARGGLSRAAILKRIRVQPPYYALEHETYLNGTFSATATAELAQGCLVGPMRPGDISRHGAIAGSCAVALAQKDDAARYYLATRASYCGFPVEAPYGTPVQFEANVNHLDKRRAEAVVCASVGGRPLARLTTTYTILKPALFERLNAQHRRPTEPQSALRPMDQYPTQWRGETGVKIIPSLPVSACSGHFDHYPAAPVALLMDQLAQVAELATPHPSYIARGDVTAEHLCWAGHEAIFNMSRLSESMDEVQFAGDIQSAGRIAGTMRLWLRYIR